ncbi:hypothetical protein HanRHA438_Chr02g0059791 [Helianthus annuus]|nr:hypothetical protein HanRHA438_Chr02g0059791 [Helianthus annuus]
MIRGSKWVTPSTNNLSIIHLFDFSSNEGGNGRVQTRVKMGRVDIRYYWSKNLILE